MNLAFNKNEDELKLLISEMARRHAKIEKGGGEKNYKSNAILVNSLQESASVFW